LLVIFILLFALFVLIVFISLVFFRNADRIDCGAEKLEFRGEAQFRGRGLWRRLGVTWSAGRLA
jgi:hypothetical protein